LVALFSGITSTIRSLCGSQTYKASIEKDIEGQNSPSGTEGSCDASSREDIEPWVDDSQSSIWYTCFTSIILQHTILRQIPARHVLPDRPSSSHGKTIDLGRMLLNYKAAHLHR
jgi:hypothetical protein